MKVEICSKYEIKGRGTAFVVNLEAQGLMNKRSKIYELFMGKEIEVDGKNYTVKGIEAFMTGLDYEMKTTAFLVKEI